MALFQPLGFGAGISLFTDLYYGTFAGNREAYVQYVMDTLELPWAFLWESHLYPENVRQFSYQDKKLIYMLRPPQWEPDEALRNLERTGLYSLNQRAWMILNEPNDYHFGSLNEEDAMKYVFDVYHAFEDYFPAVFGFGFWGPNANINGEHLLWLKMFWRYIRQGARRMKLAIHTWGEWPELEFHWNEFVRWWDTLKENDFIISECGPGGNKTHADYIAWMREAESVILPTEGLLGMAVTAVDHYWNNEFWPGLLDSNGVLTEFGQYWMEMKGNYF